MSCDLENIETLLKVVALFAGGAFFLWKLATGWLLINLSIGVTTARQPVPESSDEDWLSVQVTLEKGPTDTVQVTQILARIARTHELESNPSKEQKSSDWESLEINSEGEATGKGLSLAPGEKTHFAHTFRVKRAIPYLVHVVATGRRFFWPTGFRWRASAVSLPDVRKSTL